MTDIFLQSSSEDVLPAVLYRVFFLPPAVCQLLEDSISGVGQHECPIVSVDCPIGAASRCQ